MIPTNHLKNVKVKASVITISTTRNETTDLSGKLIHDLFEKAEIVCDTPIIVKDQKDDIRKAVEQALETESNCIVLNGGTGLTKDDITIEVVEPLFEKRIDGFGELFRSKSISQVGTAVILSRAVAGIIQNKVIFCIPGSPKACDLAMNEIILPEIRHIISHISAQ